MTISAHSRPGSNRAITPTVLEPQPSGLSEIEPKIVDRPFQMAFKPRLKQEYPSPFERNEHAADMSAISK
jgi:hypothetical protein